MRAGDGSETALSACNRLTNDTVVVADSYVEILPGLVGMVVELISAVIMMIVLDWRRY